MKKVILLGLILVSFVGNSQNKDDNDIVYIFINVDKIPEYSDGGLDGLRKHISKSFRQPKMDEDKNIDIVGEIIAEFIVEIDGSVSNIKVNKDLGYGTGDEVVRILKRMKKWTPAIKENKYVRYKYIFPININISNYYKNRY